MGEGLPRLAGTQPRRTLGVLAAIAVLGTALAAGATERLSLSGNDSSRPALSILLRGTEPARSPSYRVVVRTIRSQLSADPAVGGVRERRAGGPRATTLRVRLSVTGRQRDAVVHRIEQALDPGRLTVAFAGPAATVQKARDQTIDDLALLLLIAPLVLLILIFGLGLRAAGASLLAAGSAASVAALLCEALGGLVDISVLALVGAACGGILISLQLCLAARRGASARTIAGAALAAAAVFASLALLQVDYLAAIALGGALASLFAVPASTAAMAAVARLDERKGPDRLDWSTRESGAWRWLGGLIGWSRPIAGVIAGLATAALLVLGLAATRMQPAALASVPPVIGAVPLGIAVGAAIAATALIGAAVSRRPLLGVALAASAALPGLAAAGLLVLSFQDGRLQDLLDYGAGGDVQLGSAAVAIVAVASLAAAQAVTMGGATRQAPVTGARSRQSAFALGRFAPAAALTCVTGVAAGCALAASSVPFVKEFGAALAVGLALQLVLVQALVAPALLRLLARTRARQYAVPHVLARVASPAFAVRRAAWDRVAQRRSRRRASPGRGPRRA